jgi:hypothetical protein
MGCVHNCPTGAAIRIDPIKLFEHDKVDVGQDKDQDRVQVSRVKRAAAGPSGWRGVSTWVAVALGVGVIVFHQQIGQWGHDTGEYITGVWTLVLFILAALYSARKRMLWLSVRWKYLPVRFVGDKIEETRVFTAIPKARVFIGELRAWRMAHIVLGIAAAAALWGHMQAGPMNPLERLLAWVVGLLLVSGFLGTLIQDWLPSRGAWDESREVRLQDINTRLEELRDPNRIKDIFAGKDKGQSEKLFEFYDKQVWPILHKPLPPARWHALLSPRSGTTLVRNFANERNTLPEADRATYDKLLGLVAQRLALEQNRIELLLCSRWLNFHIALAIGVGALVIFHVIGALYFWWP